MTDATTSTTTTDTQPEEVEQPADEQAEATDNGTAEAPESDPEDVSEPAVAKARKEAAKYRERLRDTETQRDGLTATLDTLRRQIIEGQATAEGIKPAALWASGHNVADLLAADGSIDANLVSGAINTARDTLGIRRFAGISDQGARNAGALDTGPEWGSLLVQN